MRCEESAVVYGKQLASSGEMEKFFRRFYLDDCLAREKCYAVALNNKLRPIGYMRIGEGNVGNVIIDSRLVCRLAIDTMCGAIVICHNHPSGGVLPGRADNSVTTRIAGALHNLGVKLLDHIILSENDFFSYADSLEFCEFLTPRT